MKTIDRTHVITQYPDGRDLSVVVYVKVKESDLDELEQQRDEAIELLNFLYENIENVYVVESAITNYIQKAGKG